MSRRKQARPRSCRESLEGGNETGITEGNLVETEGNVDSAGTVSFIEIKEDLSDNLTKSQTPGTGENKGGFTCDRCQVTFIAVNQLKHHVSFDCPNGPISVNGDKTKETKSPTEIMTSASPASLCSATPSPRLMDTEPMSPSLAALTPDQVPFSVQVNDTHPYGCQHCDKAFSTVVYLRKHEQLHQDTTSFKCDFCSRSFKHKRSRDRHMKLHTCGGDKKYKCLQCLASFPRSDLLRLHQKNHEMGRPYSCTVCSSGFTSVGQLASHLATHKTDRSSMADGLKTFSCPLCGEDFVTIDGIQLHVLQHMDSHIEQEKRQEENSCQICSESFTRVEDLLDHMASHTAANFSILSPNRPLSTSSVVSQGRTDQITSPIQYHAPTDDRNVCPYCYRDDFPTIEILEIHMQGVHSVKPKEIYTCNYCNAPYPNLYSLHEHMRVIHKNQPCLDIKYPCNFCSLEFSSIELLANHRRQKHSRMVTSPNQHNQILESITCMQCSMVFENPTMLQNHLMLVHAKNAKPELPSTTLGKRPKSIGPTEAQLAGNSGNKHLRTALFSSRSSSGSGSDRVTVSGMTCDQCNATFNSSEDFQCHMKLHMGSSGMNAHRCEICNEDFYTSDLLDAHVFVHFLQQSTEYGCTPCAKIFDKPDELQKHLMDIHAHHLYRCSLCKEIFDSKVNIQVHFAIKHSNECKLFTCTECSSVFRSEMEWQLHVKVSHLQIAKPYRCLFCRDSFATEIELQCHLTTHKKSFHCTMCSESFHVEYLLDKHLQEVHNPEKHMVTETVHIKVEKENIHVNVTSTTPSSHPSINSPEPSTSMWKTTETCVWYTCNICDAKFNKPAALQLHKIQDHQQKINSPPKQMSPRTPVSQSTGKTNNTERLQLSQSTTEQSENDKLAHGCCFCSQTFRSKGEMDKHMKIHVNSGGQKCNICDEVFSNANVLAEHKLQHCKVPQGNVCVGCKKILKTEDQFYIHSQEHGVQGAMMQCIICRQSLASMIELQMHGKHHFQMKPTFYTCCVCLKTYETRENLISKLNASGRTYYVCKPCYHGETKEHMCGQCPASFPSEDLLATHSESHRKTYQCIKCQESFSSEYEIQVHVAAHMMQEGNVHECKLCLKNFESPAKLQCHLIEHTYAASDMRCHVCGVSYTRAVDIQSHAVEHGVSARLYSCNQCNQKFFFSAELENHLLGHTQDGNSSSSSENFPSDLECPECNTAFPDIVQLTNHRKVHQQPTGNIQCSLCQESFSDMSLFQSHFFAIHAEASTADQSQTLSCSECHQGFPNSTLLQAHKKLHTTGAEHTCPICMKVFALSRNLYLHLRAHHSDKPYECPICRKRFSRKENRKAHMKSHSNLRPFACPVCEKGFSRKSHVKDHMRIHFAQDPSNVSLYETIQETDNGSTSDTLSPASDGVPWKSGEVQENHGHSLQPWTRVSTEKYDDGEDVTSEDGGNVRDNTSSKSV